MKDLWLGIDTSNYTTSLALVDGDGEVLCNQKQFLPVEAGAVGLRQSDAVFAHVRQMPALMETVTGPLRQGILRGVGVSVRPRNHEGSYMPCFLAGEATASGAAAAAGVPLYRFSHQCGHLMAAIAGAGAPELLTRRFAAFHVSGGTTELLIAQYGREGFSAQIAGGTLDLNAGQVIDRVGTMLGFPFPCGRFMQEEALRNTRKVPTRKIACRDGFVNLSGVVNLAEKLYRDTADRALTAAFVLNTLAGALEAMSAYALTLTDGPVLYAGGVMSNLQIRQRIESLFPALFAPAEFSSDNAVGIALLARRAG